MPGAYGRYLFGDFCKGQVLSARLALPKAKAVRRTGLKVNGLASFGEDAREMMPDCRGRRPHLRDFAENGCGEKMRTILLGASNSWFPIPLSALSVPTASNTLGHTHVAQIARVEGALWILNPGSPTERRRAPARTMLMLQIADGRIVPELVTLS